MYTTETEAVRRLSGTFHVKMVLVLGLSVEVLTGLLLKIFDKCIAWHKSVTGLPCIQEITGHEALYIKFLFSEKRTILHPVNWQFPVWGEFRIAFADTKVIGFF